MLNFIFWSAFFALMGGLAENFDRGVLMPAWKKADKLTSEHGGTEKGFIVGQSTQGRLIAACVIVAVGLVVYALRTDSFELNDFLMVLWAVPMVYIGFWLGPLLKSLWGKRRKVFDAADALEKEGVASLGKRVGDFFGNLLRTLLAWIRGAPTSPVRAEDSQPSASEAVPESKPPASPGSAEEPKPEDPREILDRFNDSR